MMNTISNTRRLRQKIEQVLPVSGTALGAVVMHPRIRELYPEFLMTVHQMIRATVPLMRTALQRCRELEQTDTVAAAMVPYLTQHIKEEMHHDDWVLEDLELLGVPRVEVLRRMPPSAVASMIGAQYYWIHHHHPVAKLGMIAVMEGYPPGLELIDSLAARTGYPRAVFRTLEKHCHIDINHRNDFNDALDRMPLRDRHHAILEVSAIHTVKSVAKAYHEIVDRAAEPVVRAACEPTRDETIPLRRPDLSLVRAAEDGHYRIEVEEHGTIYQIGDHEHFLLTRCDGLQSPGEVCRAYGTHFGQPLTRSELDEFLEMARAEHLLVEAGGSLEADA